MTTLTQDQRRRIEENRRRALELRAQKKKGVTNFVLSGGTSNGSSTGSNFSMKDGMTGATSGSKPRSTFSGVGQFSTISSGSNQGFSPDGARPAPQSTTKGQFHNGGASSGSSAQKTATTVTSSDQMASKVRVSQFANSSAGGKQMKEAASSPDMSNSGNLSSGQVPPTSGKGFSSAKPPPQFYKKAKAPAETAADKPFSKGPQAQGFQRHVGGGAQDAPRTMQGFGNSWQSQAGKNANFLLQKQSAGSLANKQGGLKTLGMKLGSCLLVSKDRFEVTIPYRQDVIDCFNKLESKSYDADRKKWSFAMSEYSTLMSTLRRLPVPVEIQPLPSSVVRLFSSPSSVRPIQEANLTSVDEKLRVGLLPFQRDGVNFVIHHGGRALIADDMGLGKTIQAICVACYYRTEWPLLIVAPSSMRYSWAEAFEKWVPSVSQDDIHVIVTGPNQRYDALINIISYDLMARRAKDLAAQKYQVVIMDESHFLKNYKTARTKAAMPILKNSPRRLLLSGTPALSRPAELYMQIQALHTSMFPSYHEFGLRYCDAKQTAWGWDYSGSSNLSELQLVLERRFMIRRLKCDVLSQLPSKTRQKIILDPKSIKSNSASIKSLSSAARKEKADREMILEYYAATARLKQAAVRIYVEDLLEGDKKFLVFAHHQSMMSSLCEACEAKKVEYIRIDGSTPPKERFKNCEDFQTKDKYRVAVLSIMAANAGITLTAASLVVFAELFWNPGILMQAEDRAHRIGQSDAVFIHYLIARGTADDLLWPLVQRKLATLEKAGLSKNDFSEADTKVMKDPKQQSILNFLEHSFCSEELSQEELAALDEAESRDLVENDKVDHQNSGNTKSGTLTSLWSTTTSVKGALDDRPSKRLKTDTHR